MTAPPEITVTRTPSQMVKGRQNAESLEWANEFLAWFLSHYKGRMAFLDCWV